MCVTKKNANHSPRTVNLMILFTNFSQIVQVDYSLVRFVSFIFVWILKKKQKSNRTNTTQTPHKHNTNAKKNPTKQHQQALNDKFYKIIDIIIIIIIINNQIIWENIDY